MLVAPTPKSTGARQLSSVEDTFVYPMAVVENLTGLTRRRIRYYEKAGLLKPGRTSGGHRLYSPNNVDTLLRIKGLVDSGINTMEAVRRMMAAGFDRPAVRQPQAPVSRHWSPVESLGDAAVRLLRPIETGSPRNPSTPENDSASYFRRPNVMPNERKPE